MPNTVYRELQNLVTEARNEASNGVDSKSIHQILHIINAEDQRIPAIVEKEIPYIEKAVEILVTAFKNGGRLFYIGAGTSGRLGVLDASECPPTFGTDPGMIQGIMAGGFSALIKAIEGSEDLADQGAADLVEKGFTSKDVVCGIAASQRTPYVIGALEEAKRLGGKSLYITCNHRSELQLDVDVSICPVVGPEVVMGSTRMKAGTATKLVLNMLTTCTMIRLGKVYDNMMVDLQMNSKKLEERSKRTVMMITGVDYKEAEEVLEQSGGHVKTALVMILAEVPAEVAKARLLENDGFVRKAIE